MLEACTTPLGLILFQFGALETTTNCAEVFQTPVTPTPFDLVEYLKYFLWTLGLELPLYYFMLSNLAKLKRLQLSLLVNIATHPIIFFVFPLILSHWNLTYRDYLLSAEIFAPLVEGFIIWKLFKSNPGRAFSAALSANLISWWLGVLILQ